MVDRITVMVLRSLIQRSRSQVEPAYRGTVRASPLHTHRAPAPSSVACAPCSSSVHGVLRSSARTVRHSVPAARTARRHRRLKRIQILMASSGTADLLQEEKEEGYIPAKELVGWQPLQQAIQELVPGAPVNTATAPERLASVLRSLDGVQQRVTAVAATNIEMCLLLSSAADEIESWLNECASTPIKPGTQPGRTVLNKMLRAAGHKAIGEAWRHTGSLWQTAADRACGRRISPLFKSNPSIS